VGLTRGEDLGRQVAVVELPSETPFVVANPDGSFTAKLHSRPACFKDASGTQPETNLDFARQADGTVTSHCHQSGSLRRINGRP
jgi:hypothetical protein